MTRGCCLSRLMTAISRSVPYCWPSSMIRRESSCMKPPSVALGTFGLPCRAHPGAVPFPPQRTYTVSRCMRSPKRRQPAEASNTRPLMSLSNVACEGSHLRYFGGLVSCPPYNLPLLRVWSQRSTARSQV